jgi:hypothetical protein
MKPSVKSSNPHRPHGPGAHHNHVHTLGTPPAAFLPTGRFPATVYSCMCTIRGGAALPRAAHSLSGDETSASNVRLREVVALRLNSARTRLVIAASTVDGSSKGISMIWYPSLAVPLHARRHSGSLLSPGFINHTVRRTVRCYACVVLKQDEDGCAREGSCYFLSSLLVCDERKECWTAKCCQLPSAGSSQALAPPKCWHLPSLGTPKNRMLPLPSNWQLPISQAGGRRSATALDISSVSSLGGRYRRGCGWSHPEPGFLPPPRMQTYIRLTERGRRWWGEINNPKKQSRRYCPNTPPATPLPPSSPSAGPHERVHAQLVGVRGRGGAARVVRRAPVVEGGPRDHRERAVGRSTMLRTTTEVVVAFAGRLRSRRHSRGWGRCTSGV